MKLVKALDLSQSTLMDLQNPSLLALAADDKNSTAVKSDDLTLAVVFVWVFHFQGEPIPFLQVIDINHFIARSIFFVFASEDVDPTICQQSHFLFSTAGTVAAAVINNSHLQCVHIEFVDTAFVFTRFLAIENEIRGHEVHDKRLEPQIFFLEDEFNGLLLTLGHKVYNKGITIYKKSIPILYKHKLNPHIHHLEFRGIKAEFKDGVDGRLPNYDCIIGAVTGSG